MRLYCMLVVSCVVSALSYHGICLGETIRPLKHLLLPMTSLNSLRIQHTFAQSPSLRGAYAAASSGVL